MKRLVLFVWVLMQVVLPTMATAELYATGVQLELAFFAFALWYFNKCYTREQLSGILSVFAGYYGYIYLTDQFITEMPYYLVYIEAGIIFGLLWYKLRDNA